MHGDRLRRRGSLREIERGQIIDFSWDFPSSMVDTVSAFRSMSTKPGQAQSSLGDKSCSWLWLAKTGCADRGRSPPATQAARLITAADVAGCPAPSPHLASPTWRCWRSHEVVRS